MVSSTSSICRPSRTRYPRARYVISSHDIIQRSNLLFAFKLDSTQYLAYGPNRFRNQYLNDGSITRKGSMRRQFLLVTLSYAAFSLHGSMANAQTATLS